MQSPLPLHMDLDFKYASSALVKSTAGSSTTPTLLCEAVQKSLSSAADGAAACTVHVLELPAVLEAPPEAALAERCFTKTSRTSDRRSGGDRTLLTIESGESAAGALNDAPPSTLMSGLNKRGELFPRSTCRSRRSEQHAHQAPPKMDRDRRSKRKSRAWIVASAVLFPSDSSFHQTLRSSIPSAPARSRGWAGCQRTLEQRDEAGGRTGGKSSAKIGGKGRGKNFA